MTFFAGKKGRGGSEPSVAGKPLSKRSVRGIRENGHAVGLEKRRHTRLLAREIKKKN